jgi:hypothetical protein
MHHRMLYEYELLTPMRMRHSKLALICALAGVLTVSRIVIAQPGPIADYTFPITGGTLSAPAYTPFSLPYYPYHNGVQVDSVKYILTTQLVEGTSSTADRVIDASTGGYAYRQSGVWTGTMALLRNKRAFLILNRHGLRTITVSGYPVDSVTYISPMPAGDWRTAGPRMATNHAIGEVGLVTYGFHKSQNMRAGGDLIIDMVTRKIARCDSSGWVGRLDSLVLGHPVIIQTIHPATFDWTYAPGQP